MADLGIGHDHRRFNQLWEEEALHTGLCRVQPPQAAQLAPNFLQQQTGKVKSQQNWDILLALDTESWCEMGCHKGSCSVGLWLHLNVSPLASLVQNSAAEQNLNAVPLLLCEAYRDKIC